MSASSKQLSEAVVGFYEDEILSHADQIYRFALALTLSLEGAGALVRRTLREVSANLEAMQKEGGDESKWVRTLVSECWRQFKKDGGGKFTEGQSAVTRFLKGLSIEQRAALVAVDVGGLSPRDAAAALSMQEDELRARLVAGRRALLAANVDL